MYTKKKCKIYVLSVLLCTFFFSCSSIDFELPQGPQGTNGKSAYEIWNGDKSKDLFLIAMNNKEITNKNPNIRPLM